MFAAVLINSAKARDIPPCALPDGVTSASLENGAPPALLRALKEHVGEIVPSGAAFNPTDSGPGAHRRLIFVWNRDRRWVVATEFGGRGYADPIFAYDLSQDGQSATWVDERFAQPDTVCAIASRLLSLPEIINYICKLPGERKGRIRIDVAAKSVLFEGYGGRWQFIDGKVGSFHLDQPDVGPFPRHIVTISPQRITFGWATANDEGVNSIDRSSGRLQSADPFSPGRFGACDIATGWHSTRATTP